MNPAIPATPTNPRGGGRIPRLKPEVHAAIVEALKKGTSRHAAAVANGIPERTFYRWMAQGRAATSGIYWQFQQDVEKADADFETDTADTIKRVSLGQYVVKRRITTVKGKDGVRHTTIEEEMGRPEWTAAAWLLERKFNERWGRRDRLEIEATLREEANRIAAERGLDPDKVLDEAYGLLAAEAGR